jgi:long-chain acyl-CoA synthetase
MSAVVQARIKELSVPPPPGMPYSVPLPGSEIEGRSKVYRHWRFTDAMLKTLDPAVRFENLFVPQEWSPGPQCDSFVFFVSFIRLFYFFLWLLGNIRKSKC